MKKVKKPTKKGMTLDIDVGPAILQIYIDGKPEDVPFTIDGKLMADIIARFIADAIDYEFVKSERK